MGDEAGGTTGDTSFEGRLRSYLFAELDEYRRQRGAGGVDADLQWAAEAEEIVRREARGDAA